MNTFVLDIADRASLSSYLQDRGLIKTDEHVITLEKAGEGNMNLVLRAVTPCRSLIVKQSKAWVEKYPSISAPIERALMEGRFYEMTATTVAVSSRMPRLHSFDRLNHILVLEDLGAATSFEDLYAGVALEPQHLIEDLQISSLELKSYEDSLALPNSP